MLATGAGVCQDFAHLLIALARARGMPARYVSGYLMPRRADEDGNGLEEVIGGQGVARLGGGLRPGLGLGRASIPTLGTPTSGRHVRVAYGRDYGDVAAGARRLQGPGRPAAVGRTCWCGPALDDDGCEHLSERIDPAPAESRPRRAPPAAATAAVACTRVDARATGGLRRPRVPDHPHNPAIHLLDGRFYADDPQPHFRWMREHAPVYWDEARRCGA